MRGREASGRDRGCGRGPLRGLRMRPEPHPLLAHNACRRLIHENLSECHEFFTFVMLSYTKCPIILKFRYKEIENGQINFESLSIFRFWGYPGKGAYYTVISKTLPRSPQSGELALLRLLRDLKAKADALHLPPLSGWPSQM